MAAGQGDVGSHRGGNTARLSDALNSYSIKCTCPGQSYKHLFRQTHPHTLLPLAAAVNNHPLSLASDPSTLCAPAQTNRTQTQTHGKGTAGTSSRTSHVDVDVGSLLRALLQADVAAHVRGLSPGDVQRGHPIHLLLSPHLGPLLPLPLHRLHTPALQLEGCAERHDHVGAGGGDNGLGVACNGIETKIDVFEAS